MDPTKNLKYDMNDALLMQASSTSTPSESKTQSKLVNDVRKIYEDLKALECTILGSNAIPTTETRTPASEELAPNVKSAPEIADQKSENQASRLNSWFDTYSATSRRLLEATNKSPSNITVVPELGNGTPLESGDKSPKFLAADDESESGSTGPVVHMERNYSRKEIYHPRLTFPTSSPAGVLGRVLRPKTILPLIIDHCIVESCPDSGSEDNVITAALAQQFELTIDDGEEHQREFRIANGKVIKALGRVQVMCTFAKDTSVALLTSFYVFRNLVSDVIMGMDFLDSTETLTKHRFRLQKKMMPLQGVPRISALNNPRRRLRCTAAGKTILANADTGAEMNLVSANYAKSRGLVPSKLWSGETQVQLADGTTEYLKGKVTLSIKIGAGGPASPKPRVFPEQSFYIMEGLTCSLLLGEEILEGSDVFETYRENIIVETASKANAEICTIMWSNTVEAFFSRNQVTAPRPLSDQEEQAMPKTSLSERAQRRVRGFLQRKADSSSPPIPAGGAEPLPSFEARLGERDARELYRRELAEAEVQRLPPGAARDFAEREEAAKIEAYEIDKQALLQARNSARAGNTLSGSLVDPGPSSSATMPGIPLQDLASRSAGN